VSQLVSVVIPAFNRRRELKRALDSLAFQTSKGFEVIVCDDGSTEDLAPVVDAFRSRLEVSYIRIENSGGPARPRNTAVAMARGEWISFLDSDDWWDPDRMEKVGATLQPGHDFVYHPLRVVTAGEVRQRRESRAVIGEALRGHALTHMALLGNPIPNSAAVVRKSLLNRIGGICEDHALVAEDFDTWMRLAEVGARFHFISQPLGTYWVGADGISQISSKHVEGQKLLFARHVDYLDPGIVSAATSRQMYTLGTLSMNIIGRQKEARHYFSQARDLSHWSLRLKRLVKIAMTYRRSGA